VLPQIPATQLPLIPAILGLTALVLVTPIGIRYGTAVPGPNPFGLVIAAFAILAFASNRRAAARERAGLRSLDIGANALDGSGAIVLRWELVNGDLTWMGDTTSLFQGSAGQAPANFRHLRPYLHPDDSLYNSVSHALKTSADRVSWLVRVRYGEKGWKAFHLRGKITSDGKSSGPVFCGLLVPAEAQTMPQPGAQDDISRLTAIVEALPISFAIWDREQRLILCNRKFRQLYRVAGVAALPGTSFEELQAQAKEQVVQKPSDLCGAAGRFQLHDKRLSDGTWLQISEYWTGDGAMVSVGTDITVLKLSEYRVLEREQQMRARVAGFEQSRRQLEIQTRQLRELAESYNEEKVRAEAANQAKSEFLANVSHELRTPLNAIIGFSEMMRDGVLGPIGNPKYESYVNDINASGRYLLEMINDILDMSKIEAGRMTLSPEWLMLGPLFTECLKVVHPSAVARNVELIQAGNAQVSLFGDKRALKQVLINVLANAVKFTMPGGKVVLRAYRYRGSVRIAITDTGVGIAKHDLGRLGRPFEQVENQLTKGHKGTGLGLAISRSLVELHGGKLDIKSRVGEGTTVTCVLPVNDEKDLGQEAA
jgi:two-component system, cell cycle sensor histidine kinase PleC